MRSLSSTLTTAQTEPSTRPHPLVEVFDKIGGITRLSWTRLYEGSEDDYFHAACMPGDGSLIRLRVASGSKQLYRQRVTSPGSGSTYSAWTDWGVDAFAVAICAYGTNVWAFRIDATDGHLYRSDSTDSGASWSGWADMGDISGDATFRLAACAKSATEAVVLYADGADIYRCRYDAGAAATWESPTGFSDPQGEWYDESRAFDDDTGTFAMDNVHGNDWSAYLVLTHSAIDCGKIRYYARYNASYINQISVDVYYEGAYHNIYEGVFPDQTWEERSIPAGVKSLTKARVKFYNDGGGGGPNAYCHLHEFDFEQDNTWEAAAAWTNSMDSITGVAVTYMGDWNVVITGTELTTTKPGVWTCLLGDGYGAAPGNWSALKELTIAEAASNVTFKFPTLDMPDVFRAFFVEAYSGSEAYSRPYWTHSLATADFVDNLWREPVPFNLSSDYGVAMCFKSSYVWLTRPDGVWRAAITAVSVDITTAVLQLKSEARETHGDITVELRNDDGRFNTLGSGTYEAIKLGSEVKFSPGYHTTGGGSPEHSTGLAHWITGWEYISRGSKAVFVLHAVDGWGLLERWKARRQFAWASGDKNIFQLLNFIFARGGLEFSSFSSSSAITSHEPAFTINPGESGKTAVLRLLAMVPDVLFFRGHYGYLKHPQASDEADYYYIGAV